MQAQIQTFFTGAGKNAIDQLASGTEILITTEDSSYVLILTDERETGFEAGSDGRGEVEIRGKNEVLNNLFSANTADEFKSRMILYKLKKEAPEVNILLGRTVENAKKFQRCYKHFFRRMYLL